MGRFDRQVSGGRLTPSKNIGGNRKENLEVKKMVKNIGYKIIGAILFFASVIGSKIVDIGNDPKAQFGTLFGIMALTSIIIAVKGIFYEDGVPSRHLPEEGHFVFETTPAKDYKNVSGIDDSTDELNLIVLLSPYTKKVPCEIETKAYIITKKLLNSFDYGMTLDEMFDLIKNSQQGDEIDFHRNNRIVFHKKN